MFCFSHAKGSLDTNLVNRARDKLGCSATHCCMGAWQHYARLRQVLMSCRQESLGQLKEPALSLKLVSSHFDAMSLAQHHDGQTGVQHKAFVGIIVPPHRLFEMLEGLNLLPSDELHQSQQRLYKLTYEFHRDMWCACMQKSWMWILVSCTSANLQGHRVQALYNWSGQSIRDCLKELSKASRCACCFCLLWWPMFCRSWRQHLRPQVGPNNACLCSNMHNTKGSQ